MAGPNVVVSLPTEPAPLVDTAKPVELRNTWRSLILVLLGEMVERSVVNCTILPDEDTKCCVIGCVLTVST